MINDLFKNKTCQSCGFQKFSRLMPLELPEGGLDYLCVCEVCGTLSVIVYCREASCDN